MNIMDDSQSIVSRSVKQGMLKCAFCDKKSSPSKYKQKKSIILMILFTKFRTKSLDHMRRVSNVVLRKRNVKK